MDAPVTGKVHCAICKKRCKGDVLKLHDSYFHKDCFKCQKCSKSLESGGFFEKEGQYYCTEDYRQYFGVRCRLCDEFVEGEVVTALGNVFHRHCLHCQSCRSPFLPGDRVTLLSGRFMCKRCCSEKENVSPAQSSPRATSAPPVNAAGDQADQLRIRVGPENGDSTPTNRGRRSEGPVGYTSTDSGVEKTKSEICEPSPSYSLGSTTPGSTANRTPTRSRKWTAHSRSCSVGDEPVRMRHKYPSTSGSVTPRFASDFGKFYNQSYMLLEDQRDEGFNKDRFKRTSSPVPYPPKSPQFHRPTIHRGTEDTQSSQPTCPPPVIAPSFPSSTGLFIYQPDRERHSFRDMYDFTRIKKGASLPTAFMYDRDRGGRSPRPHSVSSVKAADSSQSESCPGLDNEEAIRLSTFPGGYVPDPSVPPPIDRYDWPAPASPAIILAEKRREKRRLMNSRDSVDTDSYNYRSAVSLDQDISALSRNAANSGMAQAMIKDLSDEKKKLSRSADVDPISASRTPSANREPPFKTRFEEHSFASPSRDSQRSRNECHSLQYPLEYANVGNRSCSTLPGSTSISSKSLPLDKMPGLTIVDFNGVSPVNAYEVPIQRYYPQVRPGYTGGMLSEGKAYSLPPHGLRSEPLGLSRMRGDEFDGRMSSMTTTSGLSVGDETWENSTAKSTTTLTKDDDDFPGYPYVLHLSTPSSIFRRREAAPPKIYPYEMLKLTNPGIPKDVDRSNLEKHLAEDEFELVFKCSRAAFVRLPEWRRNDMKKRVSLF